MLTHNLQQNTPEWLEHRATHFNASDAPAMLGISQYKTRNQLLDEMATGVIQTFDEATQRRFDAGHRFEALARPIAEQIIGQPLYPVVGSEGKFSSSFDGLTMDESICFEHKTLNRSLRTVETASDIPEQYRAQMEQQLMVSGAKICLFMASNFDADDNLLEEVHIYYDSDPSMRNRLLQGWEQFEKDLENYTHVEHANKPQAEVVMALPALSIQTSGSIAIISNLDVFGAKLNEFVSRLNLEPTDDQGFANAEAAVKVLQKAQESLEAAEANALAQAADVDTMRRTVAMYADTARKARLMLEKMVKARKEQIKTEIIAKASKELGAYQLALDDELRAVGLRFSSTIRPDFVGAAKNKRTLASLHDAVGTLLAQGKIDSDAFAKDLRGKAKWFKSIGGSQLMHLFSDLATLALKPSDDFQMAVNNRISDYKAAESAKMETERERIRAEEQAKASAAAQAEEKAAPDAVTKWPLPARESVSPVVEKQEVQARPAEIHSHATPYIADALYDCKEFVRKYKSLNSMRSVVQAMEAVIAQPEKMEAA